MLNSPLKLNEEVIRVKLQLLKFEFNAEFEKMSDTEDKVYIAKQTYKIDPKSLGQFAPAIKEMTATVTAMYDNLSKKIVIEYSYKHPSGSNGYKVVLTNNSNSMADWVDRSF
jgi:hypothetical protein